MTFLSGLFGDIKRAIVLAIGGGGDIVGASSIYNALKRDGIRAYLASIPWERYVIDPVPGPLSLADFNGNILFGEDYGIVLGETYAIHKGVIVVPQVSRVWRILKTPIIVYDASGGYEGLVRGLVNSIKYLSVDTIIGIDVGGDVLAKGFEEELWSPLLDHLALAAIHDAAKETGIRGYIGVFGLGGDGEINKDTLEEYVAELMRAKGFIGALALTLEDYRLLKDIVRQAYTEASLMPLLVFNGQRGYHNIRGGTRKVKLGLEMMMTLFFTVESVYNHSKIAKALKGSQGIYEARERLRNLGIPTELDLEYKVNMLRLKKNTITSREILEIHRKMIEQR